MSAAPLSRRAFLGHMTGVVVTFSMWREVESQEAKRLPGSLQTNRRLDSWIRIDDQGNATVCTGKVEIGQGIVTALAQIAAEELDLPLARITMISGDTDRTPNEGVTSGSFSIENGGNALRYAGAEVRGLLLELAGQRLGVPAGQLTVHEGVIAAPDGRRMGYGELASAVNLQREATARVAPKSPQSYAVVGKPIPRFDLPAKVSGGAIFIQDMRLPNMLHGRVVRPQRAGARLVSYDEAALNKTGLVRVVRDGSFLGVIADGEYRAVKLRAQLASLARWQAGPMLPSPADLHAHLRSLPGQQAVISERTAALPAGARALRATYLRPYTAHASIGPSCAIALWEGPHLTVWTHSQGVFPLRASLASVFKMEPAAVRCIHVQGSGCYGHNGADDVALDAALLARAVPGRPVRLQWMRDDEFAWEPYGPAMTLEASGAVLNGRIVDWQYDVWSNSHTTRPVESGGVNLLAAWELEAPVAPSPQQLSTSPTGAGDRNAIPIYDLPRQRVVHHFISEMPIRTSALRTLGAHANVWAVESFMDELAQLAGADPLAFRLAHLSDPRARAVIEAVKARARWQPSTRSAAQSSNTKLQGRGIGFARYKNQQTYVAVIADIEIERASGAIRVANIYAAADAGLVVNPDGLANQIEGGILQAISWTLKERVQFNEQGIRSRDWATYPILTMREAPHVDLQILNQPDQPALGAGEASCGPAAAAIANAFAQATGKRLRELPMTPAQVQAQLKPAADRAT